MLGRIYKEKRVPIVVGNCTAFAINRMFFPYTQLAHMLEILGVDILDKVITSFGMPIGPFRLQVLVGYEVSIEVGHQFVTTFTSPHFLPFSTHIATPFQSIFYTLFSLATESNHFPQLIQLSAAGSTFCSCFVQL